MSWLGTWPGWRSASSWCRPSSLASWLPSAPPPHRGRSPPCPPPLSPVWPLPRPSPPSPPPGRTMPGSAPSSASGSFPCSSSRAPSSPSASSLPPSGPWLGSPLSGTGSPCAEPWTWAPPPPARPSGMWPTSERGRRPGRCWPVGPSTTGWPGEHRSTGHHPAPPGGRRAGRLVERNLLVYRRTWIVIASGFFEPLFYLLSIGVGIGKLVGTVTGPGGQVISYTAFVAPALLASSAMNGAIYDATFNIFHKLKFAKIYDAVLATPVGVTDVALGEISWALIRGTIYSAVFLLVMAVLGLVGSVWALLVLPVAVLIGFAFAAVGMAATSYMRSWQDFDFVQLAVLPLFLFSATFYPLTTYPPALQVIVQLTPLYHGVALVRALDTGAVGPGALVHVLYLAVMGVAGLAVTSRRLGHLLLR